ncbi:MAG: hypothetical protein J3Q66DRAFT_141331 [Benniella sp.]|nr:MAG: hypothetical protein J3Q66DRAFT_141331 [Benniella sp.]
MEPVEQTWEAVSKNGSNVPFAFSPKSLLDDVLWSLGTANTGSTGKYNGLFHKNTKEVANLAPADYPDRFQPASRDQQSDSSSFQEAVISPFTFDQIQACVSEWVCIYPPPDVERVSIWMSLITSGFERIGQGPDRTLLKYSLLLAIFDPQEKGNKTSSTARRGSAGSMKGLRIEKEPDMDSPLDMAC